jgi:hypothetical protein
MAENLCGSKSSRPRGFLAKFGCVIQNPEKREDFECKYPSKALRLSAR